MNSATVTAPQRSTHAPQITDNQSADATDAGFSLMDSRGVDDGKSLSNGVISTALSNSVMNTTVESATLTMNPDHHNPPTTCAVDNDGRSNSHTSAVAPSGSLGTPAFAAEVAMMCSRVIRTALYRAGMAPSSATWRVVRFIQSSGPVRISDVARRERSTMATVSTLVNRLVKQGLVDKEKDPSDARQSLLTVTEKGRHLCNEWQDRLGEAVADDFTALSLEELTILADALPVMRKLVSEGDH
ncbi:MarR family winged helix-turn-helix transcriptional regulator [Corynebacterium kroppenstedtii]|uniref:MarR family winged helix-turn-helix transcriptional regulator n=1 Tax=Corynebacterium sp. PCR 32 TaxID=3351342 RepID=UPI003094CBFD